jgi:hypothetical protein
MSAGLACAQPDVLPNQDAVAVLNAQGDASPSSLALISALVRLVPQP